ncbi:hypothetical protein Nepgr_026081 [Nepenthes gracilis]|uniref:Uncharacterized protein n=1 Tax=Nepenthes gracilis TaxID=150966 RepID=A0AAD3Y095_NEPGR|nr:hypothetical protein Nepgr_026081 [Nepenthes gracilis]
MIDRPSCRRFLLRELVSFSSPSQGRGLSTGWTRNARVHRKETATCLVGLLISCCNWIQAFRRKYCRISKKTVEETRTEKKLRRTVGFLRLQHKVFLLQGLVLENKFWLKVKDCVEVTVSVLHSSCRENWT